MLSFGLSTVATAGDVSHNTYYCSTSDTGNANLNELVFQGTKINYIETKMLADPTAVSGWYLCAINGNLNSSTCQPYGAGEFTVGAILDDKGCGKNTSNTCDQDDFSHPFGEYVAWPSSVSGSEGEIILFDADPASSSAGVIDYLHYCLDTSCTSNALTILDNATDQNVALGSGEDPSTSASTCGNVVDIPYTKGDLDSGGAAVIGRLTDGTGEWLNSADPDSPIYQTPDGSQGISNEDPGTVGGGPNTFQIDIGGGSASTCAGVPGTSLAPYGITFTVYNNGGNIQQNYTGTMTVTTSRGHGDWIALGGENGVLDNGAADDGSATYAFDNADNGTVTLGLTNAHAEDLTLSAAASDGAGGPSDTLSFSDNAFVLKPLTTNDGSSTVVVAGRDHQFDIELWRRHGGAAGDCAIATTYESGPYSTALKAWVSRSAEDPGGTAPTIGSTTLPDSKPAAANLTNPGFIAGTASIALSTEDVGKYALHLQDDNGDFASAAIAGSVGSLVVRPYAFEVTVNGNPAATDAAGPRYVAAGADFDVTVTAVQYDGSTATPSFGQESPGETVDLSHSLVAPAGGRDGVLSGGDGIAAFVGGSTDPAVTLSWDDVGIITLNAALSDGDYLGSGADVTGTVGNVGRFYAAKLDVRQEPTAWRADSYFEQGDFIVPPTPNGHFYRAETAGFSAAAEPAWPLAGGTVNDGSITWRDEGVLPAEWRPGVAYGVGDWVIATAANGHLYQASQAGTSDAAGEPVWPTDGTPVTDGTVVWQDRGAMARLANSCEPTGALPFTYLGESFHFGLAPKLVVTALTQSGSIARNYGGTGSERFWKLTTNLGGRTYTSTTPGVASTFTSTTGAAPILSGDTDLDGEGTYTLSPGAVGDAFVYGRDGPEAPFDATVNLNLPAANLTDDDGACYKGSGVTCTGVTLRDFGGVEARFGYAIINDAMGRESDGLRLPFWTYYYNGAGYESNVDDLGCSAYSVQPADPTNTPTNPNCTAVSGDVACADVAVGGSGVGHGGSLTLGAPNKRGVLTYTLGVDPWLRFDWNGTDDDGDGNLYDDNPSADATFGIFRGDDRFLYWQEIP